MAERDRRPATYADLEAVPPHLVAEIIDGELVTHPRPSFRHGGAAVALGSKLVPPFQFGDGGGPGGWVFVDEPELHLSPDVVVPDMAGWHGANVRGLPEADIRKVTPNWVCEILSPSTAQRDRTVKRRIYARAGIGHLWLIDHRYQILEAFRLDGSLWTLVGTWRSDDTVRAPPFDAVPFELADLWPFDEPLGFDENPQALYAGDR